MTDDELTVARKYAEAYARFDVDALRAVLAPDLRFRQVNPGGYETVDSADAYIQGTADFLREFHAYEFGDAGAEWVGDRIATRSRVLLRYGKKPYVCEQRELVTVRDGRVVAIDSLCSGARPLPEE